MSLSHLPTTRMRYNLWMRVRSITYHYRTLGDILKRRLRIVIYTLAGALAGLLLLHPFSMIVFSFMGMTHYPNHGTALLHSFDFDMWPMWIWYAVLGGLWGSGMGMLVNRIRMFDGLVRICAWCGRIEDNREPNKQHPVWKRLDYFLMERGVQESHGVCPECLEQQRRKMRAKHSAPHHRSDRLNPKDKNKNIRTTFR